MQNGEATWQVEYDFALDYQVVSSILEIPQLQENISCDSLSKLVTRFSENPQLYVDYQTRMFVQYNNPAPQLCGMTSATEEEYDNCMAVNDYA